MKKIRLKVVIKDGFQKQFMDFCKQNDINCKQYSSPILSTRFGVDNNRLTDNLDYVLSVENMPICGLD